jgi:uncharacterized phage protein (TIGR02218 family)
MGKITEIIMKTLPPGLDAHVAGEVTTLAFCWKLTRRDGTVLGFTDHDRDIVVDAVTYRAASGMSPSAISASADLRVDELDIEGILSSEAIAEDDVLRGLYDYAELSLYLVNYQQPEEGALLLRTGWMGEITLRDGQFVAELRGLTQALQQTIGDIYSAGCRARFGDARCGKNKTTFTVSGTVDAVHGLHGFSDAARTEASGHFALGSVIFTSGVNEGLEMEVKAFAGGRFEFSLPIYSPPAIGDSYDAVAGCDKAFETCVVRFNNALNFRGEPHVPGTDKIMETSATRSSW